MWPIYKELYFVSPLSLSLCLTNKNLTYVACPTKVLFLVPQNEHFYDKTYKDKTYNDRTYKDKTYHDITKNNDKTYNDKMYKKTKHIKRQNV